MPEDYNPELVVPTAKDISDLLTTLSAASASTPSVPDSVRWDCPAAGQLLGVPPNNIIYSVHWCNDPFAFALFENGRGLYVRRDQPVVVNRHAEMPMRVFATEILQPAFFSSFMCDTGARIDVSGDTACFMVGCNRGGVPCDTYTFECSRDQRKRKHLE